MVVGYNASLSFSRQARETVTGHFSAGTTWYFITGTAGAVAGAAMLIFANGKPQAAQCWMGLRYNKRMSDSIDSTSQVGSTTESLIEIIRADLKLGPEAVISEETPLFGGDHDLDSLDALLLVTNIEKRFNIKIPNQDVGPDIFASVGHLARYIDRLRH